MKSEKITIIGGGNGAFAAAADLTIRGHRITLYEVPEFSAGLTQVIEKGGIDLETHPTNGLKGGFAKLHKITTDIEEALSDCDIAMVIVPSYSLEIIAKLCAPYVRENLIIALCPANFGGSLFFKKTLVEHGCDKHVWIAEFECMMYACRKKDAGSVWIRGYKHDLGCAVFPSENSNEIFERLQYIYPILTKYNNVIETGISNPNTTMHVSLMMFNLADIDNEYDRLFYRECFTPFVQNFLDELDAERLALNKIPGMNINSLNAIFKRWYTYQGAKGEKLQELASSNPIYDYSKMPTSLQHRYITEDVPFGLIPIEAFMKQYDTPHENTTALIRICSSVLGKDFYQEARTLEDMGIKGLDEIQLTNYITHGSY